MFKFRSLNTFLSILVVAVIASSVGGLVWYVNHSSYDMALELGTQTAQQGCEGTVRAIESYLESAEVLAGSLVRENAVQNALSSSYGANKAFTRLKQVLEAHESCWGIAVFDAQGNFVSGVDVKGASLAGEQRADADYVKAIIGGAERFVSPSVIRTADGALVFAAAHAIKDGSGDVVGGLAVFPRWDMFTARFLDPVRVGAEGYGFIFDSTGTVLAHGADKSLLLQNIGDQPFIREAIERGSGELWYEWEGRRKFMSVHTVAASGWLVAVSEYEDNLAATAIGQRNFMIAAGAAMVLLVAGGIVLLVRTYALRPLAAMERFAGRVAEGDFRAELDGEYRFEFAGLAHHVRAMVEELKRKLGFSEGVLGGITLPCTITGPDNRILHVNAAMCDYLGRPGDPESYVGQTSGRFFWNDDTRSTVSSRALAEQRQIREELPYVRPDGRELVVDVASTPFFDMDGNLLGTLAIWFDLTEIRAQEARIRAQHERLAMAAGDAQDVSGMVSSSAEELSAQVEQSNQGAGEQQRRTAEVATAMEEMNATVIEVARNAGSAAEMAELVRGKAQAGARVVEDSATISSEVAERSVALRDSMSELGRQAEAVGQVVTVIEDIADQTNLLALNAAIEAARAGDAGRGFAVVADEVRKLAERTMTATREVTQSVKLIQRSADENVRATVETVEAVQRSRDLAQQSGGVLGEIVGMIEQTADQVRAIATAAEQQSAASEEIASATEGIRSIADETSAAMTESARAVAGLAEQATRLQDIIVRMREG
ncbi:methyl-accepting chemotaxis protein [Desulfobaculum xiamenense]|uniref:Methyl-accepting chemotaxis protein n=1 Tax=Desulfobaculum xiamenense TaxID=995050 RepID=A0A846QSE2_9BACT|nr:methyl-accepting chemotaxis protein [Desulfobaculum xiamenense]NJB67579.1 methyl-accepting chemotaxis protein [Desulfobaculum xiamenense]